ncbi:MAG: DUF4115 domain-containing protein [Candidatus Omnitrophica bacterium]|nr:DUF4115 domain-containing protein [Candidatus Omnitrophota bacterium]MCM8831191.1 DUF4115 domain-containing protein [Candidatus Omnitrophota bacterium]
MELKELCAQLKQKRKELGYSIEEVVEKTKLYPSVIKDLEDGNLENISPAYLKGFLKIYADFLKIPVPELKSNLSVDIRRPKREKKISTNTFSNIIYNIKNIPPYIKKVIFFGLIFLVVLFFSVKSALFIIKKIPQTKVVLTEKQKNKPKEEAKPTDLKPTPPKNQQITVALTAKKNCFIKVKVDGKIFFEGIVKKGIPEVWNAKEKMELKISDASAVYIEVNGKPLPPLSTTKKAIKSLKIDSSGISIEK